MPNDPSPPARPRDNILPLRHLAAWLVLYGHSYPLAGAGVGQADLLERWLPGFSASRYAVYLFFAISGYLLTLSLLRHPSVPRYAWNRLLRVFPAYLVCLLLSVFVIGAAYTQWPLGDYLRAAGTWEHLRHNLIPTSFIWTLPGVFEGNPYPAVVNGSLWSLGLEVRWYLWLGLLAALGVLRRRWLFTLLALGWIVWVIWRAEPDPLGHRALGMVFLIAALLAHWRERIRPSHLWPLAMLAALLLVRDTPWLPWVMLVGAPALMLWLAYRLPPLPWPGERDLSYGLFLYGFPVQQALMASWPTLSPLGLCVAATMVALPCAMLSWRWVEAPALRRKLRPRVPVAAPAAQALAATSERAAADG